MKNIPKLYKMIQWFVYCYLYEILFNLKKNKLIYLTWTNSKTLTLYFGDYLFSNDFIEKTKTNKFKLW